jgi:chorismate lyase
VKRVSLARWHPHVNAAAPSLALREWMSLHTSLTAKLRESSAKFSIHPLHQGSGMCLADEHLVIGLARKLRVREREVLLCCNDKPVVFAHTVVPFSSSFFDWPMFDSLGANSLGTSLFNDPLVTRGALQFSRLPLSHQLTRRIRSAIPSERIESRLHARRCLFRRKRGLMLVTEIFLPSLANLN